jgi:preprotein translocase subunit SecG
LLFEVEEQHSEDEIVGCNGWEKTFKVAMFVSLIFFCIYLLLLKQKVSKGS